MGICGLKTSAFVWTMSTNVVVDQEKYTASRAGHAINAFKLDWIVKLAFESNKQVSIEICMLSYYLLVITLNLLVSEFKMTSLIS